MLCITLSVTQKKTAKSGVVGVKKGAYEMPVL